MELSVFADPSSSQEAIRIDRGTVLESSSQQPAVLGTFGHLMPSYGIVQNFVFWYHELDIERMDSEEMLTARNTAKSLAIRYKCEFDHLVREAGCYKCGSQHRNRETYGSANLVAREKRLDISNYEGLIRLGYRLRVIERELKYKVQGCEYWGRDGPLAVWLPPFSWLYLVKPKSTFEYVAKRIVFLIETRNEYPEVEPDVWFRDMDPQSLPDEYEWLSTLEPKKGEDWWVSLECLCILFCSVGLLMMEFDKEDLIERLYWRLFDGPEYPKPVTRAEHCTVERLLEVRYPNESVCEICQETYMDDSYLEPEHIEENEEEAVKMACGHLIGKRCITRIAEAEKDKTTCPFCRKLVFDHVNRFPEGMRPAIRAYQVFADEIRPLIPRIDEFLLHCKDQHLDMCYNEKTKDLLEELLRMHSKRIQLLADIGCQVSPQVRTLLFRHSLQIGNDCLEPAWQSWKAFRANRLTCCGVLTMEY